MQLECNPAILRSLQQSCALLSTFTFGITSKELDAVQGFDSNSIPITVDPCVLASIFKEDTFFTSWKPVKGICLSGLGGKIPIKGPGTAQFFIHDDKGNKQA
jgi:hypothetical protein